jgi:hypothetical protein
MRMHRSPRMQGYDGIGRQSRAGIPHRRHSRYAPSAWLLRSDLLAFAESKDFFGDKVTEGGHPF